MQGRCPSSVACVRQGCIKSLKDSRHARTVDWVSLDYSKAQQHVSLVSLANIQIRMGIQNVSCALQANINNLVDRVLVWVAKRDDLHLFEVILSASLVSLADMLELVLTVGWIRASI